VTSLAPALVWTTDALQGRSLPESARTAMLLKMWRGLTLQGRFDLVRSLKSIASAYGLDVQLYCNDKSFELEVHAGDAGSIDGLLQLAGFKPPSDSQESI
jgi:hypothetical protein